MRTTVVQPRDFLHAKMIRLDRNHKFQRRKDGAEYAFLFEQDHLYSGNIRPLREAGRTQGCAR